LFLLPFITMRPHSSAPQSIEFPQPLGERVMASCQVVTTTPTRHHYYNLRTLFFAGFALLLAACGTPAPASSASTPVELPTAQIVEPTQSPPVALVNGDPIPGDIYAIHLAQYQAAQAETGTLLATENIQQLVLDDLIDRQLLAQAARAEGFVLDEATIDQRLAAVVEQAGGQAAFDAWLAAQGYTADLFRIELGLEIEAGWMRTQITDAVPTTAEQVEARQILLTDRFSADRLLGQLEGSTPFQQVVENNDAQQLGYLGWFPRGYLLQPEVEEAAFALQPGQFSQVVESSIGFHLIEVLNREADRPLSPQARLALQMKALEEWLAAQRAQAIVENLLP
jgi:peptidyl-prolyl cis-trans isomerase C